MAAIKFEKCCCCIDLRVGCLIIGYLQLVATVIVTVLTIFSLLAVNVMANDVSSNRDVDAAHKEQFNKVLAAINVISIVLLPILILALAFSIVLVVGIHQDKPGHVKAFLIYDLIFIILYAIIQIVSIAYNANFGEIIKLLLNIILSVYFLLVLRSYYFKMKETPRAPAVYSA